MKRPTPGNEVRDDDDDDNVPRNEGAQYQVKRVCRGVSSPDSARRLVDIVFGVVLPTVDEQCGGKRSLRPIDELAVAEATYPLATAHVDRRWFWAPRDRARLCLAAGARRLLVGMLRDGCAPGPEIADLRSHVAELALQAFSEGSSRVLSTTASSTPSIVNNIAFSGDAIESYARRSEDSGDVIATTAELLPCTDDAKVAVAVALAGRGHCDAAVRLAAGAARRSSRLLADVARRLAVRQLSAGRPIDEVRRMLDCCRASGMTDAEFSVAYDDRLYVAVMTAVGHDGYTADDLTLLVDTLPAEEHRRTFPFPSIPDDEDGEAFGFLEQLADLRKIDWVLQHCSTPRRTRKCVKEFFVGALAYGRVDVLEHLEPRWRLLSHKARRGTVVSFVFHRDEHGAAPVGSVIWLLASEDSPTDNPLVRMLTQPCGYNVLKRCLPDPRFPAIARQLEESGVAIRAAIRSVWSSAVRWTLDSLQWAAELTGWMPSSRFQSVDVGNSAIGLAHQFAFAFQQQDNGIPETEQRRFIRELTTRDSTRWEAVRRLMREAATSHPDWFTHRQLCDLLITHEFDTVDAVSVARPDVVDEIARAYAQCGAWTCAQACAACGLPSASEWGPNGPRDTPTFEPSWLPLIPWLGKRGHRIATISEATVARYCLFRTPDPTTGSLLSGPVARLIGPVPLQPGRVGVWRDLLSALSEQGCADLALSLAAVVGVSRSGDS
jgi:hypothetical protein